MAHHHIMGWFVVVCNMKAGSVLPSAGLVALPCACIAFFIKWLENHNEWHLAKVLKDELHMLPAAYTSFATVVTFFIVFRSSQSYSRYWNGGALLQQMHASFFDAASSIIAFSKMSKAEPDKVAEFKLGVVTLFSALSAHSLCELAGHDDEVLTARLLSELEVLAWDKLDAVTQTHIKETGFKNALLFHWIQSWLIQHLSTGLLNVPPPILSRAFNELADGMVRFEDCCKVSFLPYPLPYTQVTIWLMFLHWLLTPVAMISWTREPSLCFIFAFIYVAVVWALFFIAEELENPFGDDATDIDTVQLQRQTNHRLELLLMEQAEWTPCFRPGVMCRGPLSFVPLQDLHEEDELPDDSIEMSLTLRGG